MAIGPGSRVGPYTVSEPLGEGGMGQVWRARHAILKRDDALKLLPEDVAEDPERRARFQREAEILASLNHPHIAQIHGLAESGGFIVLVMELVEGPTLADRLATGPPPLDESLSIAQQIAEALEAAHEQGIVHRDLKPANIKVSGDGTVKVLDFGLAKAIGVAAGDAHTTQALTVSGAIIGTPHYMSPEQVRGEPVDARADVWAFGCVLYETLTGRRAFSGPTVPETLSAVLGSEPDWACLPATVPSRVRALLRRCLTRDPRRRLKHMSAVRLLLEEPDALSVPVDQGGGRQPPSRIWITAAVAVATASAGFAAASWLDRTATPPVVRTSILAETSLGGADLSFALMPEGGLAYLSRDTRQILVRPLGALDAVPILTTASSLRGVFPSPDGRSIAFVENVFALKKVAAGGGPAVPIVHMDAGSRGVAWCEDDTIVFATSNATTGLQQVAATGGAVAVLTRPDPARGEVDHLQPVCLPGGRGVLFTVTAREGGLDAARVAVLERGSNTWRTVVEGGFGARYVETGHVLYAAAGALWAVRFDLAGMTATGAPVEVLPNLTVGTLEPMAHFAVSGTTLAYPRDVPRELEDVVPVWVDRDGRETPVPAPPGPYRHPRLTRDGRRLAYTANGDIFIWDVNRPWETSSRMTFAPGTDFFPVWTPDGRRIVYGAMGSGGLSNLYIQDVAGGEAERLTDSRDMQLPTGISPDGSTLVFHSFAQRLEALRLDRPPGIGREIVLVDTPFEERNGVVSPDGRWLAYEAETPTRPGHLEIFVRPFPDTGRAQWQVTKDGGMYPAWAPGGGELFYLKPDGTVVAVSIEAAGTTWQAGPPVELIRGPYVYYGDRSLGRNYDVSPDGHRFLLLKRASETRAPHFVVVQNWTSELRRLMNGDK